MKREHGISKLATASRWDVLIIGGGATGLGCAVEAASRGYKTLLLEQSDFGKGTSSRSTKLVHGGVRYLQQGNVALVLEALHERGLMLRNAPHLVSNQSFIVPIYDWWGGPFYGIGLKMYDVLAGKLGFGASKRLSKEETVKALPTIEQQGLRGGIIYHDGQFDDARMCINLAQTAHEFGAVLLNYGKVEALIHHQGVLDGVRMRDMETDTVHELKAHVIINATGVFTDEIRLKDDAAQKPIIKASRGIHLVLDREFHPGTSAIMIPQTDDGRVLFAVPWYNKVVIGTTDTPVTNIDEEPIADDQEIDFILKHIAKYLTKDPTRADVRSVFAGLRSLVSTGGHDDNTAEISRDHTLLVSASGLVTITGGKWTTYRNMAEETINRAMLIGNLRETTSKTRHLRIHGATTNYYSDDPFLNAYGADAPAILRLMQRDKDLALPIHPRLPYTAAMVLWSVWFEQARTVEDVLSRRTRSLLLDAQAAIEAAPRVARLMQKVLKKNAAWVKQQEKEFTNLAMAYVCQT